jgi:hypothetical protein
MDSATIGTIWESADPSASDLLYIHRHALRACVLQNRGAAQHSSAHSMFVSAPTSATATGEITRALIRTRTRSAAFSACGAGPGFGRRRGAAAAQRKLKASALCTRSADLMEFIARAACKRHDETASLQRINKISVLLFFVRDYRANYINSAVCHGAAGRHVAAVTCSA